MYKRQVLGHHATERIFAGHASTWVLNDYGRLHATGKGNWGALADEQNVATVTELQATSDVLKNVAVVSVARWEQGTYGNCGAAITETGRLFAWPSVGWACCGVTSNFEVFEITAFPGTPADVAVGGQASNCHLVAALEDGSVWSVGYNQYGQLGDDTTTHRNVDEPVRVKGLPNRTLTNTRFTRVAASYSGACASDDHDVYCWGINNEGQVGDGSTTSPRKTAQRVAGVPTTWRGPDGWYLAETRTNCDDTCQNDHGLVCTEEQLLRANARDANSSSKVLELIEQLGGLHGGSECTESQDNKVPGFNWEADACYYSKTDRALSTVSCSQAPGSNPDTRLCYCHAPFNSYVNPVSTPSIVQLECGYYHCCMLDDTGLTWCWGSNDNGELGISTTTDQSEPVKASSHANSATPWLDNVVEIALGNRGMCARTEDARMYCWGNNQYAQCGQGHQDNPVKAPERVAVVPLQYALTSIAVGESHACAATADDAVLCWGHNNYGQLGDGTTTNEYESFVFVESKNGTNPPTPAPSAVPTPSWP